MGLKKYLGSLRGLKINKIIDLGHGLWRMDRWDSIISRIYKLYLDSFKTPCIWQVHAPPTPYIYSKYAPGPQLCWDWEGCVEMSCFATSPRPSWRNLIFDFNRQTGFPIYSNNILDYSKIHHCKWDILFYFYQKWSLIYEPKRHND